MSTIEPGAFSSHDEETQADTIEISREDLTAVIEETEQLREENEALREHIDATEHRLDLLDSRLDATIDLAEQTEQTTTIHESRLDATTDAVDRLEADASDGDGGDPNGDPTIDSPDTPLERLLDEPQSSGIRLTESVTRALSIAGHYRQWSNKRQAGHVITQNLRTLLSTALDESLAWKQVYRACRKLDELTNGKIRFIKRQRQGWCLVAADSAWLSRVVSQRSGG